MRVVVAEQQQPAAGERPGRRAGKVVNGRKKQGRCLFRGGRSICEMVTCGGKEMVEGIRQVRHSHVGGSRYSRSLLEF